ncbi:MAG TPA: hypothetical protein VJ437_13105 [Acidiferrobacterales bacterium]|nr:hypothetical protein [Acidiferrobacterales bacterium]
MTKEIDLSPSAPWRERRDASMPQHDAAMAKARMLLGAYTVPHQAKWWADLNRAERATLVKHAGLAPERARLRWQQLDLTERRGIIEAAARAASWAQKLQGLLA